MFFKTSISHHRTFFNYGISYKTTNKFPIILTFYAKYDNLYVIVINHMKRNGVHMKKKFLSLLLSGAMCLTLLSACNQNADEPQIETDTSYTESAPDDTSQTVATTVSVVEEQTAEPTEAVTSVPPADTSASSEASQTTATVTTSPATQAPLTTASTQAPVVTTPKPSVTTTAKPAPIVTTAATTVKTDPPAEKPTYPPVSPNNSSSSHKKNIANLTAMELYKKMTVGWNLGNSLDAVGNGLSSETAWGNPKITKELINAVKAAGFDTIRIPVTWMGHFDKTTYKIDDAWLKRVDEVINYALSNDMYVIINIHHDGNDTNQSWLTPKPDNETAMVNKFDVIWYQIATYFKDYDEHLIFAGMNEFHKGYNNPSKKYLELTDKLNQTFVNTVRATGGNNAQRILIVQAYNTNIDQAQKMIMPKDTVSNKLMAEVHFYDPWDFAGEGKGDWGKTGKNTSGWGQEDWVNTQFGKMKKNFFDKNIPVILGEYGAINNRNGNNDHRRYYIEYVTKAAKENGLLPIWWDNGNDSNSGEAFALFDRRSYKKLHEDIHEAIMRAVSGKKYDIVLP